MFSPIHNRRQDAYGGSLEARMTLALESVAAILRYRDKRNDSKASFKRSRNMVGLAIANRIVAMIDCCHSGTSLKAIQEKQKEDPFPRRYKKVVPMDVLLKTLKKNWDFYKKVGSAKKLKGVQEKIGASVIQISACQDDEVAYDGHKNSLFTEYLLKVWKKSLKL